jgi:hypothetical protein
VRTRIPLIVAATWCSWSCWGAPRPTAVECSRTVVARAISGDQTLDAAAYRIECPATPDVPPVVVLGFGQKFPEPPGPSYHWAVFVEPKGVKLSWKGHSLHVCVDGGQVLSYPYNQYIEVLASCD